MLLTPLDRALTGKKTPKPASLLRFDRLTGFFPKNVYMEKGFFYSVPPKKTPICFLAREMIFAEKPVNLSNLNNDAAFQAARPVNPPVNPCQIGVPC